MANDNQRIDVALRQQTKDNFRGVVIFSRLSLGISIHTLEGADLHGISYNITMGDHDSFLQIAVASASIRIRDLKLTGRAGAYRQARSAAGIAKKRCSSRSLAF